MITCPNCQHENPSTDRFCQRCGKPIGAEKTIVDRLLGDFPKNFAIMDPRHLGRLVINTSGGIIIFGLVVLIFTRMQFPRQVEVVRNLEVKVTVPVEVTKEIEVTREVAVTVTNTPGPSITPGPSPTPTNTPTVTPSPTNTFTPTPIPTNSPAESLIPGETWREDGLALWFNVAGIDPDKIRFDLILTAEDGRGATFDLRAKNIQLVNMQGESFGPPKSAGSNPIIMGDYNYHNRRGKVILNKGDNVTFAKGAILFYDFASDESEFVTMEFVDISRINIARWRIRIDDYR